VLRVANVDFRECQSEQKKNAGSKIYIVKQIPDGSLQFGLIEIDIRKINIFINWHLTILAIPSRQLLNLREISSLEKKQMNFK
jgi:hypothetical protein